MLAGAALTTSAFAPLTPVPAPPATVATIIAPVTAPVAPVTVAAAEILAGRLALDDFHRYERQFAAVVDLADLNLELVADLDHVIDVLNPHATVQLADLGDVQEPVLAGQQRD